MFKWTGEERTFPVEGGTFNHRYEAILAADEEQPTNPKVASIIARGLKNVQMLAWNIPPKVWKAFIETHNTFHVGSGHNHLDYLDEVVHLLAMWEADCAKTGLNGNHPGYKGKKEQFMVKNSTLVMLGVIVVQLIVCVSSFCLCGRAQPMDITAPIVAPSSLPLLGRRLRKN